MDTSTPKLSSTKSGTSSRCQLEDSPGTVDGEVFNTPLSGYTFGGQGRDSALSVCSDFSTPKAPFIYPQENDEFVGEEADEEEETIQKQILESSMSDKAQSMISSPIQETVYLEQEESIESTMTPSNIQACKAKASVHRLPLSTPFVRRSNWVLPVKCKSPYQGLSQLNQQFMSTYCRNYPPMEPLTSKPTVTVPKSPTLLTSQRSALRRLACTTVSDSTNEPFIFKARPAPNFKQTEAKDEKKKKKVAV